MISVVVPAYNEEAVIERSLKHLTDGAPEGELEVIVACNGCHDRTADLARAFGRSVKVVETKAGVTEEAEILTQQNNEEEEKSEKTSILRGNTSTFRLPP